MGILERRPYDLHVWLRIATKGLATRAKERIRLEIEAHYAEAASDHLKKGFSESAARRAALAELGDAGKAAKCFRKRYLTTREAQGVEMTFSRLGSRWYLLFNYLYCAGLLFAVKSHFRSFLIPLAVVFIATVIIPTFNYVTIRRMVRRTNKNVSSCVLREIVSWYAFALSFMLTGFYLAHGLQARFSAPYGGRSVMGHGTLFQPYLLDVSYFVAIGCSLIFPIVHGFRVWLRIRQAANVWDELPLQNE